MITSGNTTDSSPKEAELHTKKKPSVHYPDESNLRQTKNVQEQHTARVDSIAATDDEDFEEMYDWSTDEDLVDEEARFEHKMGGEKARQGCGPKRYVASKSAIIYRVPDSSIGLPLSFFPHSSARLCSLESLLPSQSFFVSITLSHIPLHTASTLPTMSPHGCTGPLQIFSCLGILP
jgi:hypothetical protein